LRAGNDYDRNLRSGPDNKRCTVTPQDLVRFPADLKKATEVMHCRERPVRQHKIATQYDDNTRILCPIM
jgi:hypothetical protein